MDHYKKLLEEVLDEVMVDQEEDEIKTSEDHVMIYVDDPYQVIEEKPETPYYQVIGNEIITITKGNGVCCLCKSLTEILYTDNTYNSNIPVQICKLCIDSIMK